MNRIKTSKFIFIVSAAIIILIMASIFVGSVSIPLDKMFTEGYIEILKLRILRAALAIIAGIALSLSGAILQGILRNPLAEPYVLGVSSGAGLGAAIGLLVWPYFFIAKGTAFLGGIVTILIVFKLARIGGRLNSENMILSGVLVNALFSSLLMFFVSNSASTKVHSVIWWLLGNLQVFRLSDVLVMGSIVLACFFGAIYYSKELNAMSLGDEEALHLGIDIIRIKKILLVIATLAVAVTVSMCGIIGFLGLMAPNLTRRLVGPDHKKLLICSSAGGAFFLLGCDLISRAVFLPKEVPVGVITAFMGVPFFIYVLIKTKKEYFK